MIYFLKEGDKMKIYSVNELINRDFNLRFLNALKQLWHSTKSFQCINAPKKQDLFLYINGFTVTYTDKKKNVYIANSGDIVYIPTGSEYTFHISEAQKKNSHTIGINFLLFDESDEQITLSNSIKIFHSPSDKSIAMLFEQAIAYDIVQPVAMKKILLLNIICTLAAYTVQKNIPKRISDILNYMSEHIKENPSVKQLADICNVSEVYFRKQFKSCIGMTPVEYRNIIRLSKACSFLEYGDISVQEISDMLGYSTVSHFIKEFRTHYGSSPLKYRKQFRDG